jgi:uncharacterized membrane protein (Fun14 family)
MGNAAARARTEKEDLASKLAQSEAQVLELGAQLAALQQANTSNEQQSTVGLELASDLVPLGSQLSLGATLGYASGYALQAVGRGAAMGLGTAFIVLQGLSYADYVQVDWRKVERGLLHTLDRNGDGAVDAQDMSILYREALDVLTFNLPAGAGYTGGLLYGLGVTAARASSGAAVLGMGARLVAPRVALAGGLSATSIPAALVAAKRMVGIEDDSSNDDQVDLPVPR